MKYRTKRHNFQRRATMVVFLCSVVVVIPYGDSHAQQQVEATVHKTALVVRQIEVKAYKGFGWKARKQPMSWRDAKSSSSSPIGNFTLSVSAVRPHVEKKTVGKIRDAIGDYDMVGVLQHKFREVVDNQGKIKFVDLAKVKEIYKQACPLDKMKTGFSNRRKNKEMIRTCEQIVADRLGADRVIYLDIGRWGFHATNYFFKKSGNVAVYVTGNVKDIKTGNSLSKETIYMSFADGKYKTENLKSAKAEDMLKDGTDLIMANLEELTSKMAEEIATKLLSAEENIQKKEEEEEGGGGEDRNLLFKDDVDVCYGYSSSYN